VANTAYTCAHAACSGASKWAPALHIEDDIFLYDGEPDSIDREKNLNGI